MATKRNYKAAASAAMAFISAAEDQSGPELEQTPPAAQITGGPADPGAAQSAQDLPGRGLDRAELPLFAPAAPGRETKSARLQVLLQPSTKDGLKRIAAARGTSVNDLINTALREYVERETKAHGRN